MKNFKIIFLSLAFLASGLALSSCGGGDAAAEKTGKEYTSAYICPMHCKGSGSAEAGTCPECKMDYVVNEDHKKDGNEPEGQEAHDEHEGHDH